MGRAPQRQQQTQQRDRSPQPANKLMTFIGWKKMNTKQSRQNLPDDEAGWAENLQPIGPNDWVTVNGAAPALTTVTGKTASRMFSGNIGGIDYVIFFATDGSCTAVNANTGAKSTVAGPGTFSTTPDMTVYASQRILIMDPTKGYATWDGTLFVGSGGLSPNIHVTAGGSGYTSAPSVSFSGGSGSGAAATAVVAGGAVVAVNLTNPGTGYLATDTVTISFGGPGTGATATVIVWPQTTGTTIAVFAGRVWWANGRILNFTGTQGYDDTNPANAAGSTTITDMDLSHTVTGLRALNNYLYIFGDQSVRQIGSITVSASITLFTPLTLASDIGSSFLMTIQSYNRLVVFANKSGVYGIFGASIQKISDDLDGIFELVDFSLSPSAALNDVHQTITSGGAIHCYMLLVRYMDPVLGSRSILCVLQNTIWFVVSQGNSLLTLTSLTLASTGQWDTFASSGADVTQLLQTPGTPVAITFRTALSPNQSPVRAKLLIKAGVAVTTAAAQNFNLLIETENGSNPYALAAASAVTWINNSGGVVQWQNNTPANVTFNGGGYRFPYASVDGYGKVIGATLSGTVNNFSLNSMAFEYAEADLWGIPP